MSKINFCMAALIAITQSLFVGPAALAQEDSTPRFIPEPQVSTGAETDPCAQARDPASCAAHQAALAQCADKRGSEKQACLQEHLPPVNCSLEDNPEECAAIQQAKERCAGKKDAALTACLNPGEHIAKNRHGKKKGLKAATGGKTAKAARSGKHGKVNGKTNAKAAAKTSKSSAQKGATVKKGTARAKGSSAPKTTTKKTSSKKPRQTP